MRISVVIPTYNRAQSIKAAILSVVGQTRRPDEIIVIDDGSEDDTRAIIEAMNITNLTYVWQENAGGNAARNRGVEVAQGEWIAFHDSDDYWLPHKLETIISALERPDNKTLRAAFSAFCLYNPLKRKFSLMPKALADCTEAQIILDRPIAQARTLTANPISTQTLIVQKDLLDEIGRFDTNLKRFQDWDLAIRLAVAGPLLYISEPLCYVAISSDSVTRNYQAGLDARRRLLEKHASIYAESPLDLRRARRDLKLRSLVGKVREFGR